MHGRLGLNRVHNLAREYEGGKVLPESELYIKR